MRTESEMKPYLSYLYFAGANGDHPYFLKNDRIAIGLAVLPQDEKKPQISKQHPHQQEVVFVLDGKIQIEIKQNEKTSCNVLNTGEVFMIEPGICHCILSVNHEKAAYLFVKTFPAKEPREIPC